MFNTIAIEDGLLLKEFIEYIIKNNVINKRYFF